MEEVVAVTRASGIMLPDNCVDKECALTTPLESSLRGCRYYDLAAGRRMELEALNGTTVRLGSEHGIPTPLNFAIYATLKPFANGAPTMP